MHTNGFTVSQRNDLLLNYWNFSGTLYSKIAPSDIASANAAYRECFEIPEDCSIIEILKNHKMERITRLESKLFGLGPYGPVVDNDVLPVLPENMTRNINVPYMVGRCSGEGDTLLKWLKT